MQATMQEQTSALIRVMDELNEHFQSVLRLFEREREALSKRDIAELEEASETIGKALEDARALDVKRQRTAGTLARTVGLPERGMRWEMLAGKLNESDLSEELTRALKRARTRLRATLFAVDHANRMNQAAFKGVQVATDSILNILHGGEPAYDRQGGAKQSGVGNRFISRTL
uniref:Putative FlgN, export chaperone involved in flagellar synthesis n=1 Tax=Magnetococcus massalia (strain MO-1) TaxID=451514 RepID=A0A1S7LCP9_MAGMO|nr:putative FlgN, export chaperone involved in flagellar synthesis [Candidatus Magnetococcus massalia]